MIHTRVLAGQPRIIHHRVQGSMTPDEARRGAREARELFTSLETNSELLMVDMRGYDFTNIEAHKIWSLEFKTNRIVRESTGRIAVLGDDTPQFASEKAAMETGSVKFFIDPEKARVWLSKG